MSKYGKNGSAWTKETKTIVVKEWTEPKETNFKSDMSELELQIFEATKKFNALRCKTYESKYYGKEVGFKRTGRVKLYWQVEHFGKISEVEKARREIIKLTAEKLAL